MSGIRLSKATFRNYKVLESVEFSFDENPMVFAKHNEWGKSTFLEGIVDAFNLKTASLAGKATRGEKHKPYIEVEFELDGEKYRLTLNAQDNTLMLIGDNGKLIQRSEKSIKKFFEEKGYAHFGDVVEKLLVLRERDLSVGVASGLKKLFNDVLKTAKIEELEKTFKGMLSSKDRGFIGSLGKLYRETENELKRLNEKVQSLLKEHAEYKHNVSVLNKFSAELKKLEAMEGKLNQELQEKRTFLVAVLGCMGEFVSSRIDELRKQTFGIDAESGKKEERLSLLEAELEQVQEKVKKLLQEIGKLQQVKDKFQELEKLCEIWDEAEGLVKKELEDELYSWIACEKMLKETRGIIEVVNAPDGVSINGRVYTPGKRVLFEGEAEVKNGSLMLRVFASEGVEKAKMRIKELSQRYGSKEKLKELLDAVTKRNELAEKFHCKTREEAVRKKDEYEKRFEKLKKASGELRLLEEREKKLSEDVKELKSELEGAKRNKEILEREISNWEVFKNQLEERLEKLQVEPEKESVPLNIVRQASFVVAKECGRVESARSKVLELEGEMERFSEKLLKLKEQRLRLQEDVNYYRGLTQKAPDSKELEKFLEEKRRLEEKLGAMERAFGIAKYALKALGKLKERVNHKYLEKFSRNVSENFSRITDGKYENVIFEGDTLFFDEKEFEERWKVKRADGVEFSIAELSDGAKSQLLLAARLALVELFVKKPAFLLLDEPFAYFDLNRERKTMRILQNLADSGWQIVITTAKAG